MVGESLGKTCDQKKGGSDGEALEYIACVGGRLSITEDFCKNKLETY